MTKGINSHLHAGKINTIQSKYTLHNKITTTDSGTTVNTKLHVWKSGKSKLGSGQLIQTYLESD